MTKIYSCTNILKKSKNREDSKNERVNSKD